MSAPPIKQPVLTCHSKRRYSDEMAARAGGMAAIERHQNTDKLYTYRCPECGCWHLTKNRQPSAAITKDEPYEVIA